VQRLVVPSSDIHVRPGIEQNLGDFGIADNCR